MEVEGRHRDQRPEDTDRVGDFHPGGQQTAEKRGLVLQRGEPDIKVSRLVPFDPRVRLLDSRVQTSNPGRVVEIKPDPVALNSRLARKL